MNTTRRDLLKATGGIFLASSILGSPLAIAGLTKKPESAPSAMGMLSKHELPPLSYAYDALEPYIDAQTMQLHHDKHHLGYVNGLNKAESELANARASGDYSLIQHWSRQAAFHGAGHYLHSIFWYIMAPKGQGGGGEPTGTLADKIKEDFGNFKAFKDQFSAAAIGVEGSGWGILAYRADDQRLIVLQAENHQKLSPWVVSPILCLDVWEHAYYLKYQNRRGDYVDAWWNVVNWPQVTENLKGLMKS